jgi:hypothetical protein
MSEVRVAPPDEQGTGRMRRPRSGSGRPVWALLAAAWTLAYGACGVYWSLGGAGFPFGVGHDPAPHLSVLGDATRTSGAPAIAVLGALGTAAALVMARGRGRGAARLLLLGFASVLAAGLALVVPDFRVLVVVAYAPILLAGAPFGWPPGARFFDAIPWPVLNQFVCMVGGVVWAATAVVYRRTTTGACAYCGRSDAVVRWKTPEAARRWGRWAVAVAIGVPAVYAATRWAWALGLPLGITERFYREGRDVGLWRMGAALATLACAGSLLTLGLVQRWGEVVPRRVPLVGGRAVPAALAIVPGAAVSILVTAAGLMFVRAAISGSFAIGGHPITLRQNFGALAPELLWPLWGAGLGAATLAYRYRRRGRCPRCGRA